MLQEWAYQLLYLFPSLPFLMTVISSYTDLDFYLLMSSTGTFSQSRFIELITDFTRIRRSTHRLDVLSVLFALHSVQDDLSDYEGVDK